MPAANDPDVGLFRTVAYQRFDDAEVLMKGGRNAAAIHLAGYAVECAIKSVLLAAITPSSRKNVLEEFRGQTGHDFDWLEARYHKLGGAMIPRDIVRAFSLVNAWSTDLRYQLKARTPSEAGQFLFNARLILDWSDWR